MTPTLQVCFLLVVLAGVCTVCSSSPFGEEVYNVEQPMPYEMLLARRGLKFGQECLPQGTRCSPDISKCCGAMSCYSYQGGTCVSKRCICRNSMYYFDSPSW